LFIEYKDGSCKFGSHDRNASEKNMAERESAKGAFKDSKFTSGFEVI
jgi:hypothetical protein